MTVAVLPVFERSDECRVVELSRAVKRRRADVSCPPMAHDVAERCADVRARAMPASWPPMPAQPNRESRDGHRHGDGPPHADGYAPFPCRRRNCDDHPPSVRKRAKSARNRTPNAAAKTTTLGTVPNRAPYKSGMRTNVTDTRDTARCSAFLWVVAHVSLMGGALRSAACSLTGQRQARRPTEAPGAGAAGPWRMCRAVGYPCARARRRAGSSHDS